MALTLRAPMRTKHLHFHSFMLRLARLADGQPDAAAETIAVMPQAHPRFTLKVFRRQEPYREAEVLDKIVTLLRRAGIPD